MTRHTPRSLAIPLVCIGALYLVLSFASARANLPWCDEAWFSSPARNLAQKGYMGTSVLDPAAAWSSRSLVGINRYTYWILPLYPVAQAGWQLLAGGSLISVRLFSAFWGALALGAWFLIMRRLMGDPRIAVLAVGLLAADFQFLWASSVGRMDMMCAALGACGWAAYLSLRGKQFSRALFTANAFIAAAAVTHPLALAYFVGLVLLVMSYDLRRIRAPQLALAAVPYVLAGAGWGIYIARNPSVFLAQFGGNAGNRFLSTPGLPAWLWVQSVKRYLYMYGFAPSTHGLSRLKLAVILIYAAGLIGVALGRGKRVNRMLLLLFLGVWFVTAILDNEAQPYYLVHLIIPLAANLAVWLVWLWDLGGWRATAAVTLCGALLLTDASVLFSRFRTNAYQTEYRTASNFIKRQAPRGAAVFGSAELAFELGFDRVVDDYRLGYLSGKTPDVVVLDKRYREWLSLLNASEPAASARINSFLGRECVLVYANPVYQVYFRGR